jgi:predicted ATPase/signal transduction histidine kinase
MTILAGCRVVETLREDYKTGIYRGVRDSATGQPQSVIIKALRAAYPTPEDIAQLRHEYEIARSLALPGILQPLELVQDRHCQALLLEDFGGQSLQDYLRLQNPEQGVDLDFFFPVAIGLSRTLEQIHKNGITHRDIKPDNILLNPLTGQVKLGDFGIASQLTYENPEITAPQRMQGTLAYMSPEQTGRMNQPLDYRTDFYSLGVTFYQMLTSRLPFQGSDTMEIVHSHLAKVPPAPREIRPALPQVLSDLILKLLAKTVVERYQSASGLAIDLEECYSHWQDKGDIPEFELGRHDHSGKLQISTRIYGREAEIDVLLKAFERCAAGGREIVLVAGYSGIGKTSVVNEVHKPMVQRRGLFAAGKFDQLRRDVPYSSLIQAFRELIRQVLTESEEQLEYFKEGLEEALGPNGQLLVDVIPEIELIVGPQPPVPVLGPQETLNRFNFVLGRFVRVWLQPEHPLVLFLDDLQWADPASLKFLQTLMADGQVRHLLILGAYRDNEVSAAHPLTLVIDDIRNNGVEPCVINLGPLTLACATELLVDSLRYSHEAVEPLAALLIQRTEGNPFFLNQLLKFWYEEKLIVCNEGQWQWDVKTIASANLVGNVVELMVGKIQTLASSTQEVLKLAACIGNRFDSRTLATVDERPVTKIAADLWEALRAGLISPLSGPYQTLHLDEEPHDEKGDDYVVTYKFLHDRVQQAAYLLVDEAERPALHLKIGRLLLEHGNEDTRQEQLFDIASHLNEARSLIKSDAEISRLVRLNLEAGLKAKASAAHNAAVKYFALGQEVAPDTMWASDYATLFSLTRERSESEYLEGHFEEAEVQFALALRHAKTLADRTAVERIRIQLYITRGRYTDAVKVGLEALRALGIVFPNQASQLHLVQELAKAKWRMRGREIADLKNAPPLQDSQQETVLSLLSPLAAAAYLSSEQTLFSVVVMKSVNITLLHGNSIYAAPALAFYGLMLGSGLGDFKQGDEWGRLALELADATGNAGVRCVVYFLYSTYLCHWRRPVGEAEPFQWEAYQLGLEAGDLVYSGYAVVSAILQRATSGVPLPEQLETIQKYVSFLHWTKEANQLALVQLVRQTWRNLRGETQARDSLDGEGFVEERVLREVWADKDSGTGRCAYYITKLRLAYLWGDYSLALEMAEEAERVIRALMGQIWIVEANFFHSLSLAAMYGQADAAQKKVYGVQLRKNQRQLRKWALNAPKNHNQRYLLVKAEMARLQGHMDEASRLYDEAIAAAQDSHHVQIEALANEVAARFYQAAGRTKLAKAYGAEARYAYEKWGATAKAATLDEIAGRSGSADLSAKQTTTNSTNRDKDSELDLATVIKASQAISSEIDLGRLLQQLLRFALENAGATHGALVLRHEAELRLEALGTIDESEVSLPSRELEECGALLPLSVVQYVARTRESVVLADASQEGLFTADPYIVTNGSHSILCAPIIYQTQLNGIIFLENRIASGAFTAERLQVLGVLSAQAAISLQNAQLYGRLEEHSRELEHRVEARTNELRGKNEELKNTLVELQQMQARVIVQEKMASLGALTAGIAHEIKNPLNFVNNFASLSIDLTDELAEEIKKLDALDESTREYIAEILADLKVNSQKINEHGKRADSIVRNMLMHSRGHDTKMQPTDLNVLVREAVQLSYHGQRAKDMNFNVQIEEQYDDTVGEVEIQPQEISRVVLNLVNNACYATQMRALREGASFSPTVRVSTSSVSEGVEVRVSDNGDGIPDHALTKVFTPFFTTKPTGEGTGLGLSMSYDIVVQQHKGDLRVQRAVEQGAELVIRLPKG